MAEQPDNLVLELLRDLRADIGDVRGEVRAVKADMATKADLLALKSDVQSLRADVASDLMTMEKNTRDQIVGLRRAVVEYHSAVVGHGIIISDLEERPPHRAAPRPAAAAGVTLKRRAARLTSWTARRGKPAPPSVRGA